jgi:hypothetical protein
MKRILFILTVALAITQISIAQVINVPEKSKEHFAKKYPKATKADWKNNVTNYTASFVSKKDSYKAVYRMDGTWDYTEKSISRESLPGAVKESFNKSRFESWDYLSTAYVENNDGQKLYRIEAKKGIDKRFIFYDKSGKEVKANQSL